jgi:hypothetical protein
VVEKMDWHSEDKASSGVAGAGYAFDFESDWKMSAAARLEDDPNQ